MSPTTSPVPERVERALSTVLAEVPEAPEDDVLDALCDLVGIDVVDRFEREILDRIRAIRGTSAVPRYEDAPADVEAAGLASGPPERDDYAFRIRGRIEFEFVVDVRTDDPDYEVHRLLSRLAEFVESEGLDELLGTSPLFDRNGNSIGRVRFDEELVEDGEVAR